MSMTEQVYEKKDNILYQDNHSTLRMLKIEGIHAHETRGIYVYQVLFRTWADSE